MAKLGEIWVELKLDYKKYQEQLQQQKQKTVSVVKEMESAHTNSSKKNVDSLNNITNSYKKGSKEAQTYLEKTIATSKQVLAAAPGFAIATAAIASVYTALRALRDEFARGLKAVEDYSLSVISMSSFLTTFAKNTENLPLSDLYKRAKIEAEGLVQILEILDARTVATGKDLRTIAEQFIKGGISLNLQNKKTADGFVNIANALTLLITGQNKDIQQRQEIRALISGQLKDSNILIKTLQSIDPLIKEHLKTWKAQGTTIENIGELLKGFNARAGDLEKTWAVVGTTMETIHERILRGAFKPIFEDLIELAIKWNKLWMDADGNLTEFAITLQTKVVSAWEKVKEVTQGVFFALKNIKALIDLLPEGSGLIGLALFGGKLGRIISGLVIIENFISRISKAGGMLAGGALNFKDIIFNGAEELDKLIASFDKNPELFILNKRADELKKKIEEVKKDIGEIPFNELISSHNITAPLRVLEKEYKKVLEQINKINEESVQKIQEKNPPLELKVAEDEEVEKTINKLEQLRNKLESQASSYDNSDSALTKYNQNLRKLAEYMETAGEKGRGLAEEIKNLNDKIVQGEIGKLTDKLDTFIEKYENKGALNPRQKALDDLNIKYKEQLKVLEEIVQINDALAKRGKVGLSEEEIEKYRQNLESSMQKAIEQIIRDTSVLTEFQKQAYRNMQSFLSDSFYNAFKQIDSDFSQTLKNMFISFVDTINRMVAELAASKLLEYLLGGEAKSGGKIGGILQLATTAASAYFGGGGAGTGLGSGSTSISTVDTYSAGMSMGQPAFANGGSFTVGGTGGVDSQMVSFRASPGEKVNISRPNTENNKDSNPIINLNIAAVDSKSFADLVRRNPAAIIEPIKKALKGGDKDFRSTLQGVI